MGETGLFQVLSEANMAMFKEAGIRHIVTADPHDFYTISQEYLDQKDSLKVQHYVQFLNELMDEGKLTLLAKVDKKVTYHDPCYLGRHSKVFEEPRKLLQRIPGVIFVEMENSGADSDCCGMGGGRMWMEPPRTLVSSQSIAEKRVHQALDTGVDILLTACPFCNITLRDAVSALEKEDALEVMDITALVSLSL
jgi:Fe-S oxidoreductase